MTEGTNRVSTEELLALSTDPRITARTLEYWRHEGLLPKATRTGQTGKRPEWTYPADAREQLQALLCSRETTRQPDELRATLWFQGYAVDTGRARTSIAAVLRRSHEEILKEIAKRQDPSLPSDEAQWNALEKLARTVARQRGKNAPPRVAKRQPREERDRAAAVLFGLALGFEDAAERLVEDGENVERMIGVDAGRKPHSGLPAWLTGPASDGLADFGSIASLPALTAAVETAAERDMESARDLARLMLEGLTIVSRVTDALTLSENAAGLAAWEAAATRPMTAIWLTAFVLALRDSGAHSDNLKKIAKSLESDALPLGARIRELAELPEAELAAELESADTLPFIQRAGLLKLIAQVRDEQGDSR
jgi:DNA-binding transcriptional MerR regulator